MAARRSSPPERAAAVPTGGGGKPGRRGRAPADRDVGRDSANVNQPSAPAHVDESHPQARRAGKLDGLVANLQAKHAALAIESAMVAERERRQIAVEVHDTLSQSLVLAKMKLAALLKKATSAGVRDDLLSGLAEVTQLVEEVLGHTRTLTFDLSPPVLYELGLEPALEWLAERVATRAKLSVIVDRPRQAAKLSEERSVLLFQLVRELLNNAVRHGAASHVILRPRYRDGCVRVVISDNGSGFDPSAFRARVPSGAGDRAGGFGLFSARTRLEHLGGSLHISSAPGGPTSVTVELPVASGEA